MKIVEYKCNLCLKQKESEEVCAVKFEEKDCYDVISLLFYTNSDVHICQTCLNCLRKHFQEETGSN